MARTFLLSGVFFLFLDRNLYLFSASFNSSRESFFSKNLNVVLFWVFEDQTGMSCEIIFNCSLLFLA